MLIDSGKHKGKTSYQLVLKEPEYAVWYAREYPNSKLGKEILRLVAKFNNKSFTKQCYSCGQTATRGTSYYNNYDYMWWCDECDPYNAGAIGGKLTVVKTYQAALTHIDVSGGGKRDWKKKTIIELARGKGLPSRVTTKAAEEFFS